MKEFTDDDLKLDENDEKFFKRIENTVGKGVIACYEQFLLFPAFFKPKDFAGDNFEFDENGGKLLKRIENTVRKGEIADNEQFLLFPEFFQKVYIANVKTRACLGKCRRCIYTMSHVVEKEACSQCVQGKSPQKNGLTLSQTTNFRLFQTERVCRRQF